MGQRGAKVFARLVGLGSISLLDQTQVRVLPYKFAAIALFTSVWLALVRMPMTQPLFPLFLAPFLRFVVIFPWSFLFLIPMHTM